MQIIGKLAKEEQRSPVPRSYAELGPIRDSWTYRPFVPPSLPWVFLFLDPVLGAGWLFGGSSRRGAARPKRVLLVSIQGVYARATRAVLLRDEELKDPGV